jgi:hypothetical protein
MGITLIRTRHHALKDGMQETTYDLAWVPTLIAGVAAAGSIGNFLVNLLAHIGLL